MAMRRLRASALIPGAAAGGPCAAAPSSLFSSCFTGMPLLCLLCDADGEEEEAADISWMVAWSCKDKTRVDDDCADELPRHAVAVFIA